MLKVYAEDVIALENQHDKLVAERKGLSAAPAIMRRIKKSRITELNNQIAALGLEISAKKELIFADATSTSIYERHHEEERLKKERDQQHEDGAEPL